MIKSLLFTSFLAFSSGSSLLNKTPFHELQKQNEDFSVFKAETYFNDAFSNLNGYELGYGYFFEDYYEIEFSGYYKPYYAFPINYDITVISGSLILYYSNDTFNFYVSGDGIVESSADINIINYNGEQVIGFPFGRLNSDAMNIYIYNENSSPLIGGVIGTITEWVTGFIGVIVSGLSSFVAVFYTGEKLTVIGTLALLGLGVGLVTLAIAFVTRLFKR